jgi:phage terminase large subunit
MLSPAIHGLNDELAISQLASIKWKANLRGLTQIESKDDLKKRGIGSPDRAEAVMALSSSSRRRG